MVIHNYLYYCHHCIIIESVFAYCIFIQSGFIMFKKNYNNNKLYYIIIIIIMIIILR